MLDNKTIGSKKGGSMDINFNAKPLEYLVLQQQMEQLRQSSPSGDIKVPEVDQARLNQAKLSYVNVILSDDSIKGVDTMRNVLTKYPDSFTIDTVSIPVKIFVDISKLPLEEPDLQDFNHYISLPENNKYFIDVKGVNQEMREIVEHREEQIEQQEQQQEEQYRQQQKPFDLFDLNS